MIIANKNTTVIPTNDYVFKRIFGHVGNEEITKGFVSSIIGKKIANIDINQNPILEKSLLNEKISILDIKATLDNNIQCDIEMQVEGNKNIGKRMLFYWSKLYSEGVTSGMDYNKLKKTIIILITKFELKDLKEIHKFHTEWKIREKECSKVVLTQDLEFHIIELPKLNKIVNIQGASEQDRRLKLWAKFLLNPDEMEESEMVSSVDKDLQLAWKELNRLRQDDDEVEIAEMRLINLMHQQGVEEYWRNEGMEKGKKDKQIEIAKKLIAEKFSIEQIIKITELSKEEIEKLL